MVDTVIELILMAKQIWARVNQKHGVKESQRHYQSNHGLYSREITTKRDYNNAL